MWYAGKHEDHQSHVGDTVVIPLKPHTEIPLVLASLDMAETPEMHAGWKPYDDMFEAFCRESGGLDIHAALSQDDIDAFAPLMNWLEEPVELRLTRDELWKLHGAFDHFYWHHRPNCQVTEGVWNVLSQAVGSLDRPPE